MYTAEQILNANPRHKDCQILTLKEAREFANTRWHISTISYRAPNGQCIEIFTNNHLFGYPVIPREFVSTSFVTVDFDKLLQMHFRNAVFIETIDALVHYLNNNILE